MFPRNLQPKTLPDLMENLKVPIKFMDLWRLN
jgi:hypothetical protein